jgi:cell division protein FtsB
MKSFFHRITIKTIFIKFIKIRKLFKSNKTPIHMKIKGWIIGILIAAIVILAVFAIIMYVNNTKLNSQIGNLMTERTQLISDKEQLNNKISDLDSKMKMLQEDVNKIYKGCILNNACKGRSPGVRWYCNNVGDEVSDPSHICVCDASCQLNATQITS